MRLVQSVVVEIDVLCSSFRREKVAGERESRFVVATTTMIFLLPLLLPPWWVGFVRAVRSTTYLQNSYHSVEGNRWSVHRHSGVEGKSEKLWSALPQNNEGTSIYMSSRSPSI